MISRIQLNWSLIALAYLGAIVGGVLTWRSYQETSILLEWTTATELDTAGFNVYRSQEKDGPYRKINQTLIPSSPDPITGGEYEYADTDVEAGDTYYYQLEEVEIDGETSRFGPREVIARAGGRRELIIALILASGGLVGTALMLYDRSKVRNAGEEPTEV